MQSLSLLSGLKIRCCCELWCRSQMRLRSGVAVAVVSAGGYSSKSAPSLGTSMCYVCDSKKTKKEREWGCSGSQSYRGMSSLGSKWRWRLVCSKSREYPQDQPLSGGQEGRIGQRAGFPGSLHPASPDHKGCPAVEMTFRIVPS